MDGSKPEQFLTEFKRDVVVARRGDMGVAEIAADFGISEELVRRWVHQAEVDDGIKDSLTTVEQLEMVRLRRANRRLELEYEILCRAANYFAKDPSKMKFPLVRDLAAEGLPVRPTYRVLDIGPQALYKWQAQSVCRRELDDAHLLNDIRDVHKDYGEFGYRFISDELERASHQGLFGTHNLAVGTKMAPLSGGPSRR